MGNLLLDERPIIVIPSLAEKIGLNEAIILQQLNYWLQKSNHIYEGKPWVYNTYEDWEEQFPFWSISTIRRAISKLEKEGFIITNNFNRSQIDKTKWYTIDFEKVERLNSPSVQNEQSTAQNGQTIVQNEQSTGQNEQSSCSKWTDDLFKMDRPIPESTTEITSEITTEITSSSSEECIPKKDEEAKKAIAFFEQNGFGVVGSYVAEKIYSWCDDLSADLVVESMKNAVERGATGWKYCEAILKDWASKGIQTVEQARALQLKYKEERSRQKRYGSRSGRTERVPDWFGNNQSSSSIAEQESQEDLEAKRKRLEKIREQYRKTERDKE
ncbi:DnaD domain-containing protein [Heyndrickxia faecalis]|uniref:DnaD domain-containing protein n=1 Tax=Heyndrickxia faecalis TaxID=2824910 RepID=UPI001B39F8D2|nr:DnaD domain protein [Heyndrickxia faecalis]MBQ4910556.1 DnaD domain protein [Heyndrickxia faecalis]